MILEDLPEAFRSQQASFHEAMTENPPPTSNIFLRPLRHDMPATSAERIKADMIQRTDQVVVGCGHGNAQVEARGENEHHHRPATGPRCP